MPKSKKELCLPAIEVTQSPGRQLYTFAVDGKALTGFAAVSRIRRGEDAEVSGYQRPEVLKHIAEIRSYLESEAPMIPNAIVLAFDSRVKFTPARGKSPAPYSRSGKIRIPLDPEWNDADKPGFVVDGQQRLAAIRDAAIEGFPICVTAFITDDVQEQTEQFILVNSTKPLPKGLIYELLPGTQARLPTLLQRRRFPAALLERLNHDEKSPLHKMIQTPTNPEGVIKDNSILRMLETSLTDGALYRFRDPETGGGEVEPILKILHRFWGAVAQVFPDAWGKPTKRSRLMHGAGIISMGYLMDAIADRHRRKRSLPTQKQFVDDLAPLADSCRWTDGYWDFGPGMQRKWNEIQNTGKDIQLLTNHLLVLYKKLVWDKPRERRVRNQQPLPL